MSSNRPAMVPRTPSPSVCAVAFLASVVSAPASARATPTEAEVLSALEGDATFDYRIHAIRIGTAANAKRGLFIADPPMPRRIEVAFSMWVIRSDKRIILVDTGFTNRGMVDKWKISNYRDPANALSSVGLAPSDITDVIITHGHWDHIGGLSRFPTAKIWINEKELKELKRRFGGRLPKAFSSAKRDGRLAVTSSVELVAPSVAVVPVGLHTSGSQFVVVRNRDGLWVLASDIAPLYANFERRRPTGQTDDPGGTLEAQDLMLSLVKGKLGRIIPGHEPRVLGASDAVEITKRALLVVEEDGPESGMDAVLLEKRIEPGSRKP